MTIERARRFARAYLDEFGPKGEFNMSLPSELELEMVAGVFVNELDCTVTWNQKVDSITVEMPWKKFVRDDMNTASSAQAAGYLS